MTTPLLSRLWLAVMGLTLLACMWLFARTDPLQTDLTALLPDTEQNPQAERAVAHLGNALGNRLLFLLSAPDDELAFAAARRTAQTLSTSTTLHTVRADFSALDPSLPGRIYAPHRFHLLSTEDRQRLRANEAESMLLDTLMRPFATPVGLDPGLDPYGITARWVESLPLSQSRLFPEQGFLLTRTPEGTHVLIVAETVGSPFAQPTQQGVRQAVDKARAMLAGEFPGARLLATGAALYAHAARSDAERDVDRIALGSLAGIALLMWWVFRSLRPYLLALLSVATGIGLAILISVAVFGKLHLITLVFGASLVGEAVDYAIQYFAARLALGSEWDAWKGRRLILPAISLALLTSLLGYAALSLAPFPGLRQIALFSLTGLAGAWLTVILVLPLLARSPAPRPARLGWARWLLARLVSARHTRYLRVLLPMLGLCAVPGLLMSRGHDDVRLLVHPPQQLQVDETAIRHLAGLGNDTRFILIEGQDAETVLRREEALLEALHALPDMPPLAATSRFVPSLARQRENRTLIESALLSGRTLEQQLAAHGFAPSVAENLRRAAANDAPLSLDAWLASPLSTPVRHLWLGTTAQSTASVIPLRAEVSTEALARVLRGMSGVTLVDKAQSVSRLFGHYRHLAAWGLLLASAMVLLALTWQYGLAHGALMLMPTLLALLLTPALLAYAGTALTFFHMMALMLVLGVGVNYAIFLRAGENRAPAVLAGVVLSALTTLLSFGLLALSSLPALHQFGLALLLGVSLAALFTPAVLVLEKTP